MPTRAERTALIFVSAVVLVGGLVRLNRAARGGMEPSPAAGAALADQRRAVESAGHSRAGGRAGSRGRTPIAPPKVPRDSARRRSRDTAAKKLPVKQTAKTAVPPAPIDVDRATEQELDALPGVGPALAARIVAAREARGPFGSLDSLIVRVKGIGPVMAKALQPFVTFSGR